MRDYTPKAFSPWTDSGVLIRGCRCPARLVMMAPLSEDLRMRLVRAVEAAVGGEDHGAALISALTNWKNKLPAPGTTGR